MKSAKIQKFQKIYLEYYGVEISEDAALACADNLVGLVREICSPIKKKSLEKFLHDRNGDVK